LKNDYHFGKTLEIGGTMRPTSGLSMLLLAIANYGCAAGFHQVSFAGETSTAGSAPPAGRTVHVVRNTEMKDTVIEARIRYRLQEFLLEKGYVIAPPDTAEIYVLATFGAGERMIASTAAVFRPAEVKVERNLDGQVIRRTYAPDRMEYLRMPLLKNSLWLQVLSSDAAHYRRTGQVKNLWRGEAVMSGMPDKLPSLAAYLLVPALKYFGKGTSDIVTVDVRAGDVAWK
jgi:hypothetical protein